MNRKQKVAVVVGVVVVVLLGLFPPWVHHYVSDIGPEPWRLTRGPCCLLSPPAHPFADEVRELPHLQPWYGHIAVDWATLIPHLALALALTVAAVVVLKERKP